VGEKFLEHVTPGDEAEVHTLFCIPEVYEFLADGSPPPESVTWSWVAESESAWSAFGGGLWALRSERRSEGLLGIVRLGSFARGSAELTYVLHPKVWGQGWAQRMSHTLMDTCFRRGVIDQIWAGTDLPNTRSIQVMKRLGMAFRSKVTYPAGEGLEYVIFRDHYKVRGIDALPMHSNAVRPETDGSLLPRGSGVA